MANLEYSNEAVILKAKEYQGLLFVNFHICKIGNKYHLTTTYFTVKCGKVYEIFGLQLHDTGDTFLSLDTQCEKIGKYDCLKSYPRNQREVSFSQINKFFNKK